MDKNAIITESAIRESGLSKFKRQGQGISPCYYNEHAPGYFHRKIDLCHAVAILSQEIKHG